MTLPHPFFRYFSFCSCVVRDRDDHPLDYLLAKEGIIFYLHEYI